MAAQRSSRFGLEATTKKYSIKFPSLPLFSIAHTVHSFSNLCIYHITSLVGNIYSSFIGDWTRKWKKLDAYSGRIRSTRFKDMHTGHLLQIHCHFIDPKKQNHLNSPSLAQPTAVAHSIEGDLKTNLLKLSII